MEVECATNSRGGMVRKPSRGARVARGNRSRAPRLEDVFGFELLQVGTWGPERHLLGGARTQHTTLLAPDLGTGSDAVRAPRLIAVWLGLDRRDFSAHTLELVEEPVCRASRGRAVLLRRGLPDDLRLQPVQRLGGALLDSPSTFAAGHSRRKRGACSPRAGCAIGWHWLDFEVASVYGYLGPIPMTRRLRRAARWISDVRIPAPRRVDGRRVYLLKARKRVQTLTLVRPKTPDTAARPGTGAAEPTTKVGP